METPVQIDFQGMDPKPDIRTTIAAPSRKIPLFPVISVGQTASNRSNAGQKAGARHKNSARLGDFSAISRALAFRNANIERQDTVILVWNANPARMRFSQRTAVTRRGGTQPIYRSVYS